MTVGKERSASAALLHFLGHTSLSTTVGADDKSGATSPIVMHQSLEEHRKSIDDLSKELEKCSWNIAILLHSLDEIRQTQHLLTQKRYKFLEESAHLIAASPQTLRLPNEVLSLIAQYVNPEPIVLDDADELMSSGCKWDEFVLKSSLIKLEGHPIPSETLSGILSASSPAKLLVDLGWSWPDRYDLDATEMQPLLAFSSRWDSLFVDDWNGESLLEALFMVPCPNCRHLRHDERRGCANHTALSSLKTFTTFREICAPYSGLLRNIRHLRLTPDFSMEDKTIDFSGIATEAPLLSELSIFSHMTTKPVPRTQPQHPQTYFPHLRRVVFVQEEPSSDVGWLQSAFWALDGHAVEELCVYILHPRGDPTELGAAAMDFLAKTFPSVKSLALRAEPWIQMDNAKDSILVRELQQKFIETLIPTNDGKTIFPHLTHLSIEMDASRTGLNTLLRLLDKRYDHREVLQEIRTLTLIEGDSGISRAVGNAIDFFCRIQACVHDVVFSRPPPP